jgi:type III secretory pathway component EscV
MDNDELSHLISELESVYPDLFEELRKKITFKQMSRQIPALLKKK